MTESARLMKCTAIRQYVRLCFTDCLVTSTNDKYTFSIDKLYNYSLYVVYIGLPQCTIHTYYYL